MAEYPRVVFVQQDGRKRVDPRPAQADATRGLDRTDQRDLPLDGTFEPGTTGAGVHVYVIDSGIDVGHHEFAGRLGEGFSATDDGTGDDIGHGTHVAGTIGGTEFGVSKQVVLHPVRMLQNGTGSDVIRGVEWVTQHTRENGWPSVANTSLGGAASPALDIAVRNSMKAGVAYAVASGNEGADACGFSPARILQALSAGATDKSDSRASFSTRVLASRCSHQASTSRRRVTAAVPSRRAEHRWPRRTSLACPHCASKAARGRRWSRYGAAFSTTRVGTS